MVGEKETLIFLLHKTAAIYVDFGATSDVFFSHAAEHVPELEFTVVCLQILVWIYVNAIHSRVFILDLPANIDF
jgi:hypothetical protein